MTVGILSVQGAFTEHRKMIENLGVDCIELRQKSDLYKYYDKLILPGGESTVQGKLLKELDMFDILHDQIRECIPTMATCAGLILLADKIDNDNKTYFRTLPVHVKRNAYGRQLGSFYVDSDFSGISAVPMNFIRAPYITNVSPEVEVLAKVDGKIVGVRYKNQLGMAFHPEVSGDSRIHEMFVGM